MSERVFAYKESRHTCIKAHSDSFLVLNESNYLGQLIKRASEDVPRSGLGVIYSVDRRARLNDLAIFSTTVTTVEVALCALLRFAAIWAIDSSMVHPPTVEPGLSSLSTDGHLKVGLNDNSLEVVQSDANLLTAN
jgi:hypothetical protein